MKGIMPDTFFKRMYTMIMAAALLSHVATALCMYAAFGPPPDSRNFVSASGETLPPFYIPMLIFISWQIVIMGLAAWYGAKAFAKPIQTLSRAASKLSEDLNSPPIEEAGPAEARNAAQIFNQMQQKIQSHIEERSTFLVAVSHDLRTPLTRIRLRADQLTDDKIRLRLNQDIAEMSAMLDATLDYFRGQTSAEEEQMLDVCALAEAMAEDALECGRDVSFSGNAAPISTKPIALRRCLSNLIENALRYGEKAHIQLIERDDLTMIEVRDNGPGIPEDKMQIVFEPFVRLDASRNKSLGGVGLGLAIAREAAQHCGGTIELRNAKEGGLIASIHLPTARHHLG
ncbi:MAG: HAMP domain-containing protein [Burkholderiales bacterium]|nr:HAMP domain-containing protein [Burkholderiales bacterium]